MKRSCTSQSWRASCPFLPAPAPGSPAATPVTTFGYASTSVDRIATITDPNNDTTTFSYNSFGRVQSLQRPDSVSESLTALQMQGLTTGTATAAVPTAEAQAQYTDGRSHTWKSRLDWLGYGLTTQEADPLSDMAVAYRDTNGLPWLTADPLGDRTRNIFNTGASDPTQMVRLETIRRFGI
jgi:YD repeat-containing protein